MGGACGKGRLDIDNYIMGRKSMVSFTIVVINRLSSTSTKVSSSDSTNTFRSIMQGSGNVKSTCLEIVRKHVENKGFLIRWPLE